MVLQWWKKVVICLCISICSLYGGVSCEDTMFGALMDFDGATTTLRLYKFESKQNLKQYPIKQLAIENCDFVLSTLEEPDGIVEKFVTCLKLLEENAETKDVSPTKIYPIMSGGRHLASLVEENNEKLQSLVGIFEKTLQDKNYGQSTNGYYQPLGTGDQIKFLSIADGYVDLGERITGFNSTISLEDYSLDFLHPVKENQQMLPLFNSYGVDVFDDNFDINILQLDCWGSVEMHSKYILHLVQTAKNDGDDVAENLISPCHQVQGIISRLLDMKNKCNEDFFTAGLPDSVTLDGIHDKDKCYDTLKVVFCANAPKEFVCPFSVEAENKFIPSDKETIFKFGNPYQTLDELYDTDSFEELIDHIENICLSDRNNLDTSTDCFPQIYGVFIGRFLTHGNFIRHEVIDSTRSWHIGKMLSHSRDVKVTLEQAHKKKVITIAVIVSVFLLILIAIAGVVVYFTLFRRQQ